MNAPAQPPAQPPPPQPPASPPASSPPSAPRRSWRLDQVLVALGYAGTLLTFLLVSIGVLLWRVPALEREHQAQIEQQVRDFMRREELLVRSLERQLALAAHAVAQLDRGGADRPLSALLDAAVGDGAVLRSLALVTPDGRVTELGLPPARRALRAELLGSDVSGQRGFRLARVPGRVAWGGLAMSVLSGELTLGAALPLADGRLLLAEVPTSTLVAGALADSATRRRPAVEPRLWLLDGSGEVMADSDDHRAVGRINLLGSPLMGPLDKGFAIFEHPFEGQRHLVAVAGSSTLDWRFVAQVPAGFAHPQIRGAVLLQMGGLAGALLLGLSLAPLASRRLVSWLQGVVAHARATALQEDAPPWRPTPVREFNLLADRLTGMAHELRDRQRQVKVIFEAAPVPMFVTLLGPTMAESTLIDANEAWCRQFGHQREAVLGRSLGALNLWSDLAESAHAHARAGSGDRRVAMEAQLRHADGHALLCQVSGQGAFFDQRWVMVWGTEDIGERRRIEQALRDLNQGLEERVAQRTQALAQTNEQLRAALGHLRQTRDELLRSEKLAALGDLVAGVAHELNTPIGNSLMAVTTLEDEVTEFRGAMAQGLRRSALERLLEGIEMAMGISRRNLQRAADLVVSFKQVAVDQTSAQRRQFMLHDMVQEILLTLQPGFHRTRIAVETQVEPGVVLDSYPGALGQILTNLVTNARVHGFEGRERGRVLVTGRRLGSAVVELVVEDDGVGIAPALAERVFDPFVTTRMGRGGTGLGLHIAHNAAHRILGGSLELHSSPGTGTRFTLRIPAVAPRVAAEEPREAD